MKMLHVTVQTNEFEEELQFYLDIVGLKIITDMREMGPKMVFLANTEGDTEIEIIGNPSASPIVSESLSVGFKTEDVQKKYEELKTKGITVSQMIRPNPHVQFFFVNDPAGLKVQFM